MQASQKPTFSANIKPYTITDGEDAAKLAAAFFGEPLKWQQYILDILLARDKKDKYLHRQFALSIPRQNGKSWVVLARCIYGLITEGENILYTCQHSDTADEMFTRIADVFDEEKYPELCEEVGAKIRRANGQQFIALTKTGGKIQFKTRTNSLVRGKSFDVVIYDEAQDLTDAQYAASRFTTSASKKHNVQIVYIGTPPDPECSGTVLRTMYKRVHSGESKAPWAEWAIDDIKDANSRESWYATNPSLGTLIDEQTVEDERNDAPTEVFARERLGFWGTTDGLKLAIDETLWNDAYIDEIGDNYNKRTALGVKFSPDGTVYALAGCKMSKDGTCAIELIEIGSMALGVGSLAQALLKRTRTIACVAVDGQAGVPTLCEHMKTAPKGFVHLARVGDVIAAAGLVLDGLRDKTLKHTRYGQEELDKSALGSYMRPIGKNGGWGFGTTEDATSYAIEAASLAYFAVKNTRRDPKRKQMIL